MSNVSDVIGVINKVRLQFIAIRIEKGISVNV